MGKKIDAIKSKGSKLLTHIYTHAYTLSLTHIHAVGIEHCDTPVCISMESNR